MAPIRALQSLSLLLRTPCVILIPNRLPSSQLLSEISKLNLSKYVEEVAVGVGEATLKVKDLPAATAFCSAVHCSYADFEGALLPQLIKNATLSAPAPPKPGAAAVAPESDSERSARLGRKRSALRLLFELVGVGMISDATPVSLMVTLAVTTILALSCP